MSFIRWRNGGRDAPPDVYLPFYSGANNESAELFKVAGWFMVVVLVIFFCLGLVVKFIAYCKAGG